MSGSSEKEELRFTLLAMQAELSAVRERADFYAAKLKEIRASTSWRVTGPLRTISDRIKAAANLRTETLSHRSQRQGVVSRTPVHGFVDHIAQRCGCRRLIYIGGHQGCGIALLHPDLEIVGMGAAHGPSEHNPHPGYHEWISADLGSAPVALADRSRLHESVIFCSDALTELPEPDHLLKTIRDLLEDAPYAVLVTPDRTLIERRDEASECGSAARWSYSEFLHLLGSAGLKVVFSGFTFGSPSLQKNAIVAVVGRPQPVISPPSNFRVLALMDVYNEEDVIASTLEHLIGQGVEIHLVDNWSTDRTIEIAGRYLGHGVRHISRFPAHGPVDTRDLYAQLRFAEMLAHESDADWLIRVDADEIRESPWPEVGLREALYRVDQEGFNAIDHTVLDFRPTEEAPPADLPLQCRMPYFEFGRRPGHFLQIKGWKRQHGRIDMASSGGHEVLFSGRRVYPFKFLLRHYPIRSQEHGRRKILVERIGRLNSFDREIRGWHKHLEPLAGRGSFVWDPGELLYFDDTSFYREYVVERLTGVGIVS